MLEAAKLKAKQNEALLQAGKRETFDTLAELQSRVTAEDEGESPPYRDTALCQMWANAGLCCF